MESRDNEVGDHTCSSAQRFLFDEADIRGESVQVVDALGEILNLHQYAPAVARLLGEFIAAAVLISSTLKFEGRFTLQARSRGQIPLIMAECTSALEVRAIARGAGEATSLHFAELLRDGQLTITVDPLRGGRYQGIVPIVGDSLAHTLDAYFAQSEQLQTRLWLGCDGERAGGLLLQQLPAQVVTDAGERSALWEHACTLAETVEAAEITGLRSEQLLYRLFHQDRVRLFTPRAIRFACSCSRDRSLAALATLDRAEISSILREQGAVTMDCEFCNRQYVFSSEELFHDADKTLH